MRVPIIRDGRIVPQPGLAGAGPRWLEAIPGVDTLQQFALLVFPRALWELIIE
jgi:hypothetical protein